MLKIIITAAITILALADGPVLQTGQTKSYNADGNVVPYGSIKDDGYYRAGKVRSYSRSGDIVIDNVTGLEWQDNVESVQKPWDEFEGDTAANYCAVTLSLGGHDDWRLPSIVELSTLVDYTRHPTVTEGVFNYIIKTFHWSSTVSAQYDTGAWTISFSLGDSMLKTKSDVNNVRCIRGGQLPSSNLSRDNEDEIVTDSTTGLQWQDDVTAGNKLATWTEAINYCENTLTLGGHDDWRLPNINELYSIIDFTRYDPALNTCIFENFSSSTYWSSTTKYGPYSAGAWTVYFPHGYSFFDWKSGASNVYVRCVRGGQINIPVNPPIIMYLLD